MIYPVDIVMPVWNRPVETRACLAALVDSSPHARIIMVNYGSERETERILDEFAEALDDRAMLVSTGRNVGRVAALNHGITLSSAPFVVIVQEEIPFGQGWLEPLIEVLTSHPDVGMAIPSGNGNKHRAGSGPALFHEVDHGSLGVMMLRRQLYSAIGGLDESMDGGFWCLRDYSRRAERAGFRTVCVPSSSLVFREPAQLGSLSRREERSRTGEQLYRHRWGNDHSFCIALAGPEGEGVLANLLPVISTAARQGNSITLIMDKGVARQISGHAADLNHGGIAAETLPVLFTRRALQKRLAHLARTTPELLRVVVAPGTEGDASDLSVVAFTRMIEEISLKYYRLKGAGDAAGS